MIKTPTKKSLIIILIQFRIFYISYLAMWKTYRTLGSSNFANSPHWKMFKISHVSRIISILLPLKWRTGCEIIIYKNVLQISLLHIVKLYLTSILCFSIFNAKCKRLRQIWILSKHLETAEKIKLLVCATKMQIVRENVNKILINVIPRRVMYRNMLSLIVML